MKKTKIIQAALLVSGVILIASCSSGRYYSNYPPPSPERYGASVSLIISPFPGLNVTRYYDGRYCYRDPRGYIYWRGNDNRYYLDRTYIGHTNYDRREYREWKHFKKWRDRDDDRRRF